MSHDVAMHLQYFIKNNNIEWIKDLYAKFGKTWIDTSWKNTFPEYISPLHDCSEYGNIIVFEHLVDIQKYNINELTNRGTHCIHLCAYYGKISLLNILIKKYNISPELKTLNSLCNPLILASRNNHINCVKLLVNEYNVELNDIDHTGSTALHRASGWNNPDIILFLSNKG